MLIMSHGITADVCQQVQCCAQLARAPIHMLAWALMQLLAEVSAFLDGLRTAAAAHPMVQAEPVTVPDENGTCLCILAVRSSSQIV